MGFVKKEGSTWYFQTECGVDLKTGKRKRKKQRGFKTKREAEKALNQVEVDLAKGTYIAPSKMLFKDFLEEWFKGKLLSLGPQSTKVYRGILDFRVIPKLGNYQVSSLSPVVIQAYVNDLKHEGLANSTIAKVLKIIKSSLETAKDLELILRNPASKISVPKEETKRLDVWNKDEVITFLNLAKTNIYYLVFHLALYTGMRQGEILGLRWEDIDFDGGTICVRQTLSHDGKTFLAGAKTKASIRTITIADETIALLKKQRNINSKQKLKLGSKYNNHKLVMCVPNGNPINPSNLRRTFNTVINEAKVKKIRFHDLRHTHATLLIINGTHVKVVAERLGHSNVKITLDRYYHVMPNMQKEVATQLSAILGY
jgi:integrase